MQSEGWIDLLRAGLADEFADRPRVCTLATVDTAVDGAPNAGVAPDARSVVCRAIEADGTIWFVSDARSRKNAQLREHPRAAIVFWLAKRREQFRLSGRVVFGDAEHRSRIWGELSDAARALFAWPAPGGAFDAQSITAGAFPAGVPASDPPTGDFEVLILHPAIVERLDLNPHPHDRRRWTRADESADSWLETRLNP